MLEIMQSNFEFNNLSLILTAAGSIVIFSGLLLSWQNIKKRRYLYILLLAILFLSFIVTISTNSWFLFIIAWETATLVTSLMLLWDNKNAAWEYFLIQFIGGSILVFAALYAYTSGYTRIMEIEQLSFQILFAAAVGIKSGIIVFHLWIPYIYKSASPAFCALSSSLVANFGYILLLKIIPNQNRLLLYLGMIMIFYGAIKALEESNYKLMLAYSSISQYGFILLAVASGSIYGYYGAVIHMTAHSLAKSVLFNVGEIIFKEYKSYSIFSFKEFYLKHKAAALSSALSLFSLMALPIFLGYNSKYLIKYSLSSIPILEFLLHLGSILTIIYSFKILWALSLQDIIKYKFWSSTNSEKSKGEYITKLSEKISLVLPSLLLIVSAFTLNNFLKESFDFQYLSGAVTSLLYLLTAYIIRDPIISRIKQGQQNS